MNETEKRPSFEIVELPVEGTAPWRHLSGAEGRLHPFGPHDPGPGDADLDWVLGLEQQGELAAAVWLRHASDGGWPSLGVAAACVPTCDGEVLIDLLDAGLRRVAASGAGHVTVRLPLERSATLQLLQQLGFTVRSLLVFGGIAEAELDLAKPPSPA